MRTGDYEVHCFGKSPDSICRQTFSTWSEATDFIEKVLTHGIKIFNCCLYCPEGFFNYYWTGRGIVRMTDPWALSRAEAAALYYDETGEVNGLPFKYSK